MHSEKLIPKSITSRLGLALLLAVAFLLTHLKTTFADETKLKVGVILPLSGLLAEYGVAARNGIEMARQAKPDNFTNIQFLFEDSQYDNKLAISAFHNLRDTKKVHLIFLWGFAPVQAVAPIAEKLKFPLLACTAEGNISAGKDYVIRFNFQAEQIGEALAKYLKSNGQHKLAIVKTEHVFFNAVTDGLKNNLSTDDSLEIIQNYTPGDLDFVDSVAKLKQRKFDAVGVFLLPGQISQFFRKAAGMKLELNSFGTHLFEGSREVFDSGSAIEGAVYAAPQVLPEFQARYVAQFGNADRISFAGNAYDFANLIGRRFNPGSGTLLAEDILKILKDSNLEQGVAGEYSYKYDSELGGRYEFPVVIRQISGGRFNLVEDAA